MPVDSISAKLLQIKGRGFIINVVQPGMTERGAMAGNGNDIEKKLWAAADQLRANTRLKSFEYSVPVLGLIFLRYADHKFTVAQEEIKKHHPPTGRRAIGKTDYQTGNDIFMVTAETPCRWRKIEGANL